MNNKIINFLEEHVEKLVLAIVGLLCMWLLATNVLFSPNTVEYKGRKFKCSTIDRHILEQADVIKADLEAPPKPVEQQYVSRMNEFNALFANSVGKLPENTYWNVPVVFTKDIIKRYYAIPQIPDINNVSIEHFRAAAYLPKEEVTQENPYSSAETEINDVDFITVSADIDLQQLSDNFYQVYASENVKEDWRDPCLAVPVFAAVQLERQEKINDLWTDWAVVPRAKIDLHSEMYELIEDATKLPVGGIGVRLVEFSNFMVQKNIIQPPAYDIASAEQLWMPPVLHKKYVERMQEKQSYLRRLKMAEERQERENVRKGKLSQRRSARKDTGMTPPGAREGGNAAPGGLLPRRTERTISKRDTRETRQPQTLLEKLQEADPIVFDDIFEEFEQVSLAEKENFTDIEKLTFWANDDTIKPGGQYRYRIKVALFNPVAGTDQFIQEFKHRKNQVMLWSNYSQTTPEVKVPERIYFYAQSIYESTKTVTARIFKYKLGYWYMYDFFVRPGEAIGKVVDTAEANDKKTDDDQEQVSTVLRNDFELPEKIDYSTGALMVDVVGVKGSSDQASYSTKPHWEMLYTYEAQDILKMPVSSKYWDKEQLAQYNELVKLEKQDKQPYKQRSAQSGSGFDRYRPNNPNLEMPMPPGAGEREDYLPPGAPPR